MYMVDILNLLSVIARGTCIYFLITILLLRRIVSSFLKRMNYTIVENQAVICGKFNLQSTNVPPPYKQHVI